MDEKFLVKLAKQGDVDAFGKLYEGVYKKLYRYATIRIRYSAIPRIRGRNRESGTGIKSTLYQAQR